MKKLFYPIQAFLLVICVLVHSTQTFAQTHKPFSSDSLKFLEEIDSYFSDVRGKEKEGHEFIKETFKPFWLSSTLSHEARMFVYTTCGALTQKRLHPYPDYYNFFSALMNFYKAGLKASSFKSWETSVKKLCAASGAKKLSDFLEASNNLFGFNKLYKSNSVEWFTNAKDYDFEYDSLPKITFNDINLYCAVKGDTATIFNTSGIYYPTEKKWVGKGGKVTWKRVGIDDNLVYAELKKYDISLSKQRYSADSVKFTNKIYFKTPLLGTLDEKAVPDANTENATYPRFESYSTHFEINNIADGRVDFAGGFTLRGSKFIGSGNDTSDASLTFKRNHKPLVVASSKTFIFKKDEIAADDAAIIMHLDTDSIYHPSIKLKFDVKKKELILIRTEEGISKTPYFNTFHKVDMSVEEIDWKLDSAKMEFKTLLGNSQGVAEFVSSDYFRSDVYYQLQGMDQINPLVALKQCGDKLGRKTFTGEEYAHFRKVEARAIRPYLIPIANGGFIIYNPVSDKIILQDRLENFLKAKMGTADYDVIGIHSKVNGGGTNAVLNLLNYDLRIYGVKQISLSDSQNVAIFPMQEQVLLKKNRDFAFGGIVSAGRFAYFGKDFYFDYKDFKIDINNADSLMFSVRRFTPDPFGNFPDVRVKSVMEQISGNIQIDRGNNKSGRLHLTKYPVFTSTKESFTYYDKRSIQRGVYKRDKFYFKIDPYSLDSLDDFSTRGLKLKGQFTSAGIFPDFRDTLSIQPDYSLGFVRKTPPSGFASYGNKGKFINTISLSNAGLHGDGNIRFLTSILSSKNMTFFPDSVNGTAQQFEVTEKKKGSNPEYPPVKADTVYVHWSPKKDLMQVYTMNKPMDMYKGQALMNGRLDYSSKAMTGNGKLEFSGAIMTADLMKFKNTKITSDTASFSLKALEKSQFAFSTKNVNAIIDFEKRTGDFAANGKGSTVNFPVNQYICYMDNFKWFMDKGDIELSSRDAQKPKDARMLELSGPEFISTNPKQDSLRFTAPKAKFDFKNYIITAEQVKWINVADAKVYPDSGKVIILKDAEMKTLSNSKIVANSITAYHTIYKANTNIFGRKNYSASGYYDYVDEMKKKQPIYLANIRVDTTYQTIAEAEIKDSAHFMLSPNYEFKGKVNLASNNQFLVFSGYTKITNSCTSLDEGKHWLQFTTQINPEKILIPISDNLVDEKNKSLGSSVMVAPDTSGVYSAFLTPIRRKSDQVILKATGFLYYDKGTREYRIASKEKLNERSLPGNYLSLKSDRCLIHGEGKMGSLGTDLGQVKLNVVGNVTHDLKRDSATFQIMMALDFFFDNSALDKMADLINNTTSLQGIPFDANYENGLREFVGKEQADKMISELNLYGKFKKYADLMEHTLFLSNIKMKWDNDRNAYISSGPIGISSIRKTQINKMVNGKIALWKKRAGDIMDIYLEIDKANWYYFRYTKGMLTAVSSDQDFNKIIQDLKADKREQKGERGQTPYHFSVGSEQQKTLFIRKLKQQEE